MRKARVRVVVASLALALGLAGCAGGGQADDSAAGLTGEPVKVMTIAPVNSQTLSFPGYHDIAQVYEKWINANGGINGRPYEVILCDDRNDPNQAAKCAREAVDEGVVAVTGSYTAFGDKIVPVLEDAGIVFQPATPQAPAEFSGSNVFPTSAGGLGMVLGQGALAGSMCEAPAIVTVANPAEQATVNWITSGLASQGKTPLRHVSVPAEPGDYSAQVSEAVPGADCLVTNMGQANYSALIPALQQAGVNLPLIGHSTFDDSVVSKFPDYLEGSARAFNYAPGGEDGPELADYRAAIAQYGEGKTFLSLAIGGWAGHTVFTNIAKSIDGEITAESVMAQMNQTTDVDSGGLTSPMDYTKPWDAPGAENFTRLFGRSTGFQTVSGGKLVATDGQFHDQTKTFFGQPNPDAAPSAS